MSFNGRKVLVAVTAAVLLTSVSVRAYEMDDRIESSANGSYVFKTYLKNGTAQAQCKDGIVILTGIVDEEFHKLLAQETVASLPGVKSVDNQLKFKGVRLVRNSDQWMSRQVKTSLLFNRHVGGINIEVFVKDGIVTLKGEAESGVQKHLSGECAKDVVGVKDVKNEMTITMVSKKWKQTINEKIDDASITAQVKMVLSSHHSTSAFKTGIDISNGVATLSGRTGSAAGKNMAAKVVSDVQGVTNVVNNMTIDDFNN